MEILKLKYNMVLKYGSTGVNVLSYGRPLIGRDEMSSAVRTELLTQTHSKFLKITHSPEGQKEDAEQLLQ